MGIISSVKYVLQRSFGLEQLKQQTADVKTMAESLAPGKETGNKETFEEALVRLNLTESDIAKREREFYRLYTVFRLIFLGLCLYLGYVLYKKAWIASFGTVGVMLVVLAQLFRYHFWLFQVSERRLGCSFKEWMRSFWGKKEGVIHE